MCAAVKFVSTAANKSDLVNKLIRVYPTCILWAGVAMEKEKCRIIITLCDLTLLY